LGDEADLDVALVGGEFAAHLLAIGRGFAMEVLMHPGSLTRQYNVCGKAGCRCKDRAHPRRHGAYYKVSYV
jgi:hypothetical protein